jgi:hypothetical protein
MPAIFIQQVAPLRTGSPRTPGLAVVIVRIEIAEDLLVRAFGPEF